MSVDGMEVAAVGDDFADLARWRGDAYIPVARFASRLTRPVYDSRGYLWVGGQDADGSAQLYAMHTVEATGEEVPQPVEADWLRDRRVVAVAVAADAARLLVLSSDRQGEDLQLGVAGIIREPSGAPSSVGEPLRLAEPLQRMIDVTWLDENSFAVLGSLSTADPLRPWIGTVGAGLTGIRRRSPLTAEEARVAPLPEGVPVSVTSVGGSRGLLVISDANVVWVRTGAAWHQIGRGTDVVVPGR